MFTRDLEPVVIKTKKSGFALRAWAQDSGLAEDSKFLSHWFGLTGTSATMDDQLPRPSAWNYFTEGDDVGDDAIQADRDVPREVEIRMNPRWGLGFRRPIGVGALVAAVDKDVLDPRPCGDP